MANEITVKVQLKVAKNGATIDTTSLSKAITMAGNGMLENVQTITSTTSQLNFGGVTAIGHLCVVNVETSGTDRVNLSQATPAASSGAWAHIGFGDFALVPTRQNTVYAKTDVGSVKVLVAACDL